MAVLTGTYRDNMELKLSESYFRVELPMLK